MCFITHSLHAFILFIYIYILCICMSAKLNASCTMYLNDNSALKKMENDNTFLYVKETIQPIWENIITFNYPLICHQYFVLNQ